MSTGAERFIDELAKREMLPEPIIKRLWDKVANSSSVPSARSLATFLVDKGHLSRADADEALEAAKPQRKPRKPKPEPKEPEVTDASLEAADEQTVPTEEGGAGKKAGKPARRYKKKTKGDNEFDTPLMLLGSGGLVLLLLCGGGILFLLFRESGDALLKDARKAFEAAAYRQAAADYGKFVEKFTNHEGISGARVMLALARIRETPETNFEQRLKKAQQEIPPVEDEEEFPTANEELASILPAIAKGLADKADAATEVEEIGQFRELARDALVLCANTKYVPTRLRDKQELNEIEIVLQRVQFRQEALTALGECLGAMSKAVANGDTKAAYQAHSVFVKAHPEKAGDPLLIEQVAATSKAEQQGIELVAETAAARTSEAESAVTAAVATADRRKTDPAPAGGVVVVRVQGAAYALSRKDGAVLWRRAVGSSLTPLSPVVVGDACLLVDVGRQELVLVDAATGKLRWRTKIEDEVTQPVVAGGNVLAAGRSGKLHLVQLADGKRLGYVKFAQQLRSPPVYSDQLKRVYLVGEHSSVYTLDAGTYECLGVHYLGHAHGAVVAQPAVVLSRLVVLENDGAATSRLHVLTLNDQGVVDKEPAAEDPGVSRLTGLATRPPAVFGKQFVVATESGFLGVFEASADGEGPAFTPVVRRETRRRLRSTPYTAMIDRLLWVAGSELTRYSIQASANKLRVNTLEQPLRGDTFIHPLDVSGGVVTHVRRRRGRAGVTVAASDARSGALYWETDIAAPAAGPPVAAAGGAGYLHVTAAGSVFAIDDAAIRRGVTERTVRPNGEPVLGLLDSGASSGPGALYVSRATGAAVGVSTGEKRGVSAFRLPGKLAAPPLALSDGWLTPMSIGQLLYINQESGAALAAPFQPEVAPKQRLLWSRPIVVSDSRAKTVLINDGANTIYSLDVLEDPSPHLAENAIARIETGRLVARLGAASGRVAAATEEGVVKLFDVATLEPSGELDLGSPVVWGPHGAGSSVIVATADQRLHALSVEGEPSVRWSSAVEADGLIGLPMTQDGSIVLTQRAGSLVVLAAATGEVTSRISLGQSVATAPMPGGDGGTLLLAARDGALLFIDPPARQ